MIGVDITVSVKYQSVKYQSLLQLRVFTVSAALVKKSKINWMISYSHNVLTTFYHDAPNSHIARFNFLEFLVDALPATQNKQ